MDWAGNRGPARPNARNHKRLHKPHTRSPGRPRKRLPTQVAGKALQGLQWRPSPFTPPSLLQMPPGIPLVWTGKIATKRLHRVWEQLTAIYSDRMVSHTTPGLDPELISTTLDARKRGVWEVRCSCMQWSRILVQGPDRRWACPKCHPSWPAPRWLRLGEFAFALRVGQRQNFSWERRKIVALLVEQARIASTPEDAFFLAVGGALIVYRPLIYRMRGIAFRHQTAKRPRTALWRAMAPFVIDAYVDAFLHPSAFLARYG